MASTPPPTTPTVSLLSRALQIKNETVIDANTAQRIGQLFFDIIMKLEVRTLTVDSWDIDGNPQTAQRELVFAVNDLDSDVKIATNEVNNMSSSVQELNGKVQQLENADVEIIGKIAQVKQWQDDFNPCDQVCHEIETRLTNLESKTSNLP
jgi:outer membrane murein-binding lipoprotein Lpp